MLQILQIYHAGSRVDGPPQVTVASSFLIILIKKSSSPLQVPIPSPQPPDMMALQSRYVGTAVVENSAGNTC